MTVDDEITIEDVDQVVHDAITHLFDSNHFVDAFFWQTCIRLLQKKYDFRLQLKEKRST